MIVIVKGIKHEVATIAEARALSGLAPAAAPSAAGPAKRVNPWGDESNGKCNRCHGTGVWGNRDKGGSCFRCDGTGVAPGYKGKTQVAETEPDYGTGSEDCYPQHVSFHEEPKEMVYASIKRTSGRTPLAVHHAR